MTLGYILISWKIVIEHTVNINKKNTNNSKLIKLFCAHVFPRILWIGSYFLLLHSKHSHLIPRVIYSHVVKTSKQSFSSQECFPKQTGWRLTPHKTAGLWYKTAAFIGQSIRRDQKKGVSWTGLWAHMATPSKGCSVLLKLHLHFDVVTFREKEMGASIDTLKRVKKHLNVTKKFDKRHPKNCKHEAPC